MVHAPSTRPVLCKEINCSRHRHRGQRRVASCRAPRAPWQSEPVRGLVACRRGRAARKDRLRAARAMLSSREVRSARVHPATSQPSSMSSLQTVCLTPTCSSSKRRSPTVTSNSPSPAERASPTSARISSVPSPSVAPCIIASTTLNAICRPENRWPAPAFASETGSDEGRSAVHR
jgi:hypothetical protein